MCGEVNPRDLVHSTISQIGGDTTSIEKEKRKKKKNVMSSVRTGANRTKPSASLVSVTESVILRKNLPERI